MFSVEDRRQYQGDGAHDFPEPVAPITAKFFREQLVDEDECPASQSGPW